MSYIIYITLIFAVLLFVIVVCLFVIRKKQLSKVSLTATIDIFPSGKSNVEFEPYHEVDESKLMKIALLYLVKIRYISATEPNEIFEMFKEIIEDIADSNEFSQENYLQSKINEYANGFRVAYEEPATTNSGERFVVKLIEGTDFNYVDTKIPFPRGLVANLLTSVIFLFEEVIPKFSTENIERFEHLLKFTSGKLFLSKEMSLNDMTRLNSVITNSFKITGDLIKENTL